MDRLGFFKHGLGRILETAQSVIGLKQAVNTFTEVVDEALSEIQSDMGLHLPTLDAAVYENPEHALQELSRMGYTAIEVGSYFNGKVHYKTPAEFRALADKMNLKITSAHLNHLYEGATDGGTDGGEEGTTDGGEERGTRSAGGTGGTGGAERNKAESAEEGTGGAERGTEEGATGVDEVETDKVLSSECQPKNNADPNDEWWREALKIHKGLGCKYIAMQRMPEEIDAETIKVYAQYFNRIGELALQQGMKFQYHPTQSILQPNSERVSFFDTIAEMTDPEKVWFQIDTLEVKKAGIEPISLLERYADRILTLHLHDYGTTCESGEIDFEKLIAKAIKLKIEELYIEVNNFSLPPINCAERSLNNVLTLPSVRY